MALMDMNILGIYKAGNNQMKSSKKHIFIIVTIVLLFLIIPVSFFVVNIGKTATLSTTIAPSFATITIDNKKYKANTSIKFRPTHTKAIISADGFQSQEIDIDLNNNETTSIYLYLTPDNGDLSWYANNQTELRLYSTINDFYSQEAADAYIKKYPITSILPAVITDTKNGIGYRIDIGKFEDCKSDFCIKITDQTGGNRDHALEYIRQKGFNPDDYELIYVYEPYFTGAPAHAGNN